MKEMLSKAFKRKQTTQTFLVNNKKKNNLTDVNFEILGKISKFQFKCKQG